MAQANLIDFDSGTNSTPVGDTYLASDGVSFVNGSFFTVGSSAPSPSNVLLPDDATITVDSVSNALVTSVGIFYASNSVGSGQSNGVPSLSVYSGTDGTGSLLGTLALPDTPNAFAGSSYTSVSLSFAGAAHSVVLSDFASSHILYDDLSFTVQPTPEPSVLAALGLGAMAALRRKKR